METTNAQVALKLSEKLSEAITLLIIHGIITAGERDEAQKRLDTWATKNGLTRKGHDDTRRKRLY